MKHILVLPVANGILPRPDGGRITGMFLPEVGGELLTKVGVGSDLLACPWSVDDEALYPVGVLSRIVDISPQTAADQNGQEMPVVMITLEGRGHARWHFLQTLGGYAAAVDVEMMNFAAMRKDYPVVSGAGWMPEGGMTEFRGKHDIPVTIYGKELANGQDIAITANLGGLVSEEHAHTIEHAVIRALRMCGLCTPRTLIEAMSRETEELKMSVETSIRLAMPEVLGHTASGACGNPMTNLARFYLTSGLLDNIRAGKALDRSLRDARRTAMSQLTGDLGLTMNPGVRVLQGLKKGMAHDDTPLKLEQCKKVIKRFPFDPWT